MPVTKVEPPKPEATDLQKLAKDQGIQLKPDALDFQMEERERRKRQLEKDKKQQEKDKLM